MDVISVEVADCGDVLELFRVFIEFEFDGKEEERLECFGRASDLCEWNSLGIGSRGGMAE
jgi:hypothetical protein